MAGAERRLLPRSLVMGGTPVSPPILQKGSARSLQPVRAKLLPRIAPGPPVGVPRERQPMPRSEAESDSLAVLPDSSVGALLKKAYRRTQQHCQRSHFSDDRHAKAGFPAQPGRTTPQLPAPPAPQGWRAPCAIGPGWRPTRGLPDQKPSLCPYGGGMPCTPPTACTTCGSSKNILELP